MVGGMKHLILSAAVFFAPIQATACDLALALAVDISGSVDQIEYDIQMKGLAAAMRDSVVAEALVRAQAHVMLVQWTGSSRQDVTLPWTPIRTFEDAKAYATRIENAPRRWRNFSTAIGEALEFVVDQWADAPECKRKIIDVSGDGISNEGVEPKAIHGILRALGITVNALAIEESEADLTAYFWENLILGENAFVVTANSFEDYPDRIRQKLIREVTAQLSCAVPICWDAREEG